MASTTSSFRRVLLPLAAAKTNLLWARGIPRQCDLKAQGSPGDVRHQFHATGKGARVAPSTTQGERRCEGWPVLGTRHQRPSRCSGTNCSAPVPTNATSNSASCQTRPSPQEVATSLKREPFASPACSGQVHFGGIAPLRHL